MKEAFIGILCGIIIVIVLGFVNVAFAPNDKDYGQEYFDHGKYCQEKGVPAEANPYDGDRGKIWLNGWAEGAASDEVAELFSADPDAVFIRQWKYEDNVIMDTK